MEKSSFNSTHVILIEKTCFQLKKRAFNVTNVLLVGQKILKSRNTPSSSQWSDFYNELALKNSTFIINTQQFFLAFNCCFSRSNLFTVSDFSVEIGGVNTNLWCPIGSVVITFMENKHTAKPNLHID